MIFFTNKRVYETSIVRGVTGTTIPAELLMMVRKVAKITKKDCYGQYTPRPWPHAWLKNILQAVPHVRRTLLQLNVACVG